MSKSVKVPEVIWETLVSIKHRDKRKNMGEVISDLLIRAKEVKENDKHNED